MAVRLASTESDFTTIRRLFRDYDSSLDVELSTQGLDEEIATLPGQYASPQGALFVGEAKGAVIVGVVGVRRLADSGAAELKRLYVSPAGRGLGIGRALVAAAMTFSRNAGYVELKLDTLPSMTTAIKLYQALGFKTCASYGNNTLPGLRYFSASLSHENGGS